MDLVRVSPSLNVQGSVAIVGSSALLCGKQYGEEIDAFDHVVRINRSPTIDWEETVGSKTTIRAVNTHIFRCEDWGNDRWSNEHQPQYFVRDNVRDCKLLFCGNYGRHYPQGIKYIHESVDVHFFQKRANDSVGFEVLSILIDSGIIPTVYGYVPVEPGLLTHYYERRDNKSLCHNFKKEDNQLQKWSKQGIINLIDG